jgi:putative Mg2+ transporter-C (MgtC) family protein
MSSIPWEWADLLKLLLAAALGFIIGFERQALHKPAGITTITIVTLSSALLMELSYRLSQLGASSVNDPARLAAAVMTGIGFLGAGVILQAGGHVQGITTSAVIWLMAGIGLAVGAGYYVPALAAVAIVLLSFWINPLTDKLVGWRSRMHEADGSNKPEAK